MTSFSRGSEWRKWDLHFHTPSSYDYKDNSISDETIIEILEANQIAVVAITDHHIIDIKRIKNLQTLGKDKVTVLPGIEFLSDAKGNEPIHFIGIFPENCDLEYIWGQLENLTNLKDIKGRGKRYDEVYCNLSETIALIKKLGGVVSIHAGYKSNSVENITHSLPHGAAQKTDIAHSVDIYELGKAKDAEGYIKSVFPSIKKVIPMIICSDNHNIKNYVLKENCWIKADPTFEGLKQIIYEPEERVKIQKENPSLEYDKHVFTNIAINSNIPIFNEVQTPTFGPSTIPVNQYMVAIIGGRGTGKSMLINYIAARLNKDKDNLTDKYSNPGDFIVDWSSSPNSGSTSFDLSEQNEVPFLYISQSEVKDKVEDPSKLSKEILKLLNITDTVNFSIKDDEITESVRSYVNIAKWLQTQEEGIYPNSTEYINKEILRVDELIGRYSSPKTKDAIASFTNTNNSLAKITSQIASLDHIIKKTRLFTDEINASISTNDLSFTLLDTSGFIDSALAYRNTLETTKINFSNTIEAIKRDLSGFSGDSDALFKAINNLNLKKAELSDHLKLIESKKSELTKLKISIYEFVTSLKNDFLFKQAEIRESWESLLHAKGSFTPEQQTLIKSIISDRGIQIQSGVSFDVRKLHSRLSTYIDGRSVKSKNSPDVLNDLLGISGLESYYDFLATKALEFDTFERFNLEYWAAILDIFFSQGIRKEYLSLLLEVTYNGKDLSKISIGQRGTVFLCIKLATNAFSEVIVFDQPEDDLDNEFIINELVGIFRSLKKYRQVIIVTHNANLVVNSDVEQVIIATNSDEVLTYTSGSLENPSIISEVCKVLEGGKDAFEKRRNKYSTLQ